VTDTFLTYSGNDVTVNSKTGTIKIDSSDLSLDAGPTASMTKFKLDVDNGTNLYVDVTWKHPCRYATIYDQVIPPMTAELFSVTPVTFTVP